MQHSLRKQSGLSFITILLIIAVVGIFLAVGFKLGPHYMNFATVRSVMNDVANDPELKGASTQALMSSLESRLNINGLDELVSTRRGDFEFQKASDGTEITVLYETRQLLFGNLTALMEFSHEVKIDN